MIGQFKEDLSSLNKINTRHLSLFNVFHQHTKNTIIMRMERKVAPRNLLSSSPCMERAVLRIGRMRLIADLETGPL
jgi:hypothetical protein